MNSYSQLIIVESHRNILGNRQLGCSGPISIFYNKLQYVLKMVYKTFKKKKASKSKKKNPATLCMNYIANCKLNTK